ncbi:hypothetical protein [Hymenobacter caeli]
MTTWKLAFRWMIFLDDFPTVTKAQAAAVLETANKLLIFKNVAQPATI